MVLFCEHWPCGEIIATIHGWGWGTHCKTGFRFLLPVVILQVLTSSWSAVGPKDAREPLLKGGKKAAVTLSWPVFSYSAKCRNASSHIAIPSSYFVSQYFIVSKSPLSELTGLSWSALLTKYYSGVQINKNEMGGHIARMVEGRGAYRVFGGEVWGKKNHMEDLGVDGRILLK